MIHDEGNGYKQIDISDSDIQTYIHTYKMTYDEGNNYTDDNLNVRMSLVASTKLSTTPLLFTMREELGITQYSHSVVIIYESNGR